MYRSFWKLKHQLLMGLTLFSMAFSLNSAADYTIIDAHSHFDPEDQLLFDANEIERILDEAKVAKVVITGFQNRSTEYLFNALPDRVIPILSLYQRESDKGSWSNRPEQVGAAFQQLTRAPYRGVGELHLFADQRSAPAFTAAVESAKLHQLPLIIHGDAEVIERAFEIYPEAKILWAHLSTNPDPGALSDMLNRFPEGLYIDTSVRDQMLLGNEIVNGPRSDRLTEAWRRFFIEHQDRIMVAVDAHSTHRWGSYAQVVASIQVWLSQLPESVARKLAQDNARRFFDLESR